MNYVTRALTQRFRGYTYYMMGIPIPIYTPILWRVVWRGGRLTVIEQHDGNRLIRPGHPSSGFWG